MNIAILGATGKFGMTFTTKLLAVTNHKLTLISKSAGNIYEDNHRITAKSIDATNIRDLKKALKDQDLIYFAISGFYNWYINNKGGISDEISEKQLVSADHDPRHCRRYHSRICVARSNSP